MYELSANMSIVYKRLEHPWTSGSVEFPEPIPMDKMTAVFPTNGFKETNTGE